MKYTAEYIDKTTLNQALRLLKDLSGNESYYGADDKYVQWQYFDSPFKTTITGDNDYSILVFLDEKKTILALEAFLPWKTFVNGKEIIAVWETEWVNFSKIKGLGRELTKLLREKSGIFCAYGLNHRSLRAYGSLGYAIKEEIERKIAILNADKCLELFFNNQIKGQKEFLMQSEISCLSDNIRYFDIKNIEKISEKYWLNHIERFRISSFKDKTALKWRYFEHPYIEYNFIALDPEAKMGLAVVRVEKIGNFKKSILRILELFPGRRHEKDLVMAVLKFGFDQGVIMADFFCVSKKYCDEICPSPFIPFSEHRQYEIPMLFHPIEVRETMSINMILDHNITGDAVSFDNFYATKGDSDRDVFIKDN